MQLLEEEGFRQRGPGRKPAWGVVWATGSPGIEQERAGRRVIRTCGLWLGLWLVP